MKNPFSPAGVPGDRTENEYARARMTDANKTPSPLPSPNTGGPPLPPVLPSVDIITGPALPPPEQKEAEDSLRGILNDIDGETAELRLRILLLSFRTADGRRFAPLFMGAKAPDFDFFVRLLPGPGFFLAQSKSSRKFRTAEQSLTVSNISKEKFNVLAEMPAPVYLLGLDHNSNEAFVVAVNKPRTSGTNTIRVDFPLRDQTTLAKLYDEVLSFWNNATSTLPEHVTSFPFADDLADPEETDEAVS